MRFRELCNGASSMDEARDSEGGEKSNHFCGHGAGFDVPICNEEIRGGREGKAESLMPPRAPEAVETFISYIRESAPIGCKVPRFSSLAEDFGAEEKASD